MSDEKEHKLLNEIYYLTNEKTKNWRLLLELGSKLETNFKRKLLWVWPTEVDLLDLKELLQQCNITTLLSIGCGNGLLEWLMRESINVCVNGLEIDRNWWQSKYAIKKFIELKYVDDSSEIGSSEFLSSCSGTTTESWNFALLFCYFNNRAAFLNYLNSYQGKWILIIGPPADNGVHTDPAPLTPAFPSNMNWILRHKLTFATGDMAVFYERID